MCLRRLNLGLETEARNSFHVEGYPTRLMRSRCWEVMTGSRKGGLRSQSAGADHAMPRVHMHERRHVTLCWPSIDDRVEQPAPESDRS